MAIFSYGMKIFKIAFQHVVDNSCMVHIAPFSATNFSHMTLFWRFGGKHLFLQSWIQLLNGRLIFVFVLGNGLDICDPQNRIPVFRYMVKFSKYDIFYKKNAFREVHFIFLITLGNDINRISTSQITVLKYTLCTLT